ncbi:MAG TPA: MFS transporter [Thermopolyspora sp.]
MPASALGEAPAGRRAGLIVGVLSFCGIVVSLMQTLVVPLLPDLPRIFGTSAANTSWVMTVTLLTAAVSNPVSGRLGDMYGKRQMLLINLALLVAGSVIVALSSALMPVIIGRALQGCAIGVIPLGISIMRDELPHERLGSAMALMSATLGIGAAIGMPLAAWIVEHADWHAMFWMSAGIGLLDIPLVALFVRESSLRSAGRFDFVGAVGLTIGLVCLLIAITQGGGWGWGSGRTLGLLAAAVVTLILWGVYELRRTEPLVDLRTSSRRPVLLTNMASILIGFTIMAMMLVLPQLLLAPKATGYGLALSMMQAGLCMAPGGVMMMLLSPVSAWISRTWGPKASLMIGAGVMGVSYALGIFMTSDIWQIMFVSTAISAGLALAYAAMPALIMDSVPETETAAANGLNALMRSIGTSASSAVTSAVMSGMTMSVGALVMPTLRGLQVAMAIATAAAVGGLLITAFVPGGRNGQPTTRCRTSNAPARSLA